MTGGWSGTKRFYNEASCQPAGDGYGVLLDGKPVRTPAGAPLSVGKQVLAEAMAQEWAEQVETINPETMPMTKLTATAIDRIEARRNDIVEVMIAFAGTDLLCYRAEEPPELVTRQETRWQPLIDWASESVGAPMEVTTGVVPIPQPSIAIDRLRDVIEELDSLRLAGVSAAAAAAGSLIVAVALERERINAQEAAEIALLDEEFQMERWGADEEAVARHRRIRADIAAAHRFLHLLNSRDT